MKVRKKPDIVDAWEYTVENRHYIINLLDQHRQEFLPFGKSIVLHTRDGELTLSPGDYLIRGVQGNFYNCKPEIFNETYQIQGVHFE